ncbi:Transcription factor spt20 [Ascosphaera acerosa]|nr:Transcription factor spt20 [Ascosphaera acerosa]
MSAREILACSAPEAPRPRSQPGQPAVGKRHGSPGETLYRQRGAQTTTPQLKASGPKAEARVLGPLSEGDASQEFNSRRKRRKVSGQRSGTFRKQQDEASQYQAVPSQARRSSLAPPRPEKVPGRVRFVGIDDDSPSRSAIQGQDPPGPSTTGLASAVQQPAKPVAQVAQGQRDILHMQESVQYQMPLQAHGGAGTTAPGVGPAPTFTQAAEVVVSTNPEMFAQQQPQPADAMTYQDVTEPEKHISIDQAHQQLPAAQTAVPQVRNEATLLSKYALTPPSLTIHLFPHYLTINNVSVMYPYAGNGRYILRHLRDRTVPHDLIKPLLLGCTWFEGCLIVRVVRHEKAWLELQEHQETADAIAQPNPHTIQSTITSLPQNSGNTTGQTTSTRDPRWRIWRIVLWPTAQSRDAELGCYAEALERQSQQRGGLDAHSALTRIEQTLTHTDEAHLNLAVPRDADEARAIVRGLEHRSCSSPPPLNLSEVLRQLKHQRHDKEKQAEDEEFLCLGDELPDLKLADNAWSNSEFDRLAMIEWLAKRRRRLQNSQHQQQSKPQNRVLAEVKGDVVLGGQPDRVPSLGQGHQVNMIPSHAGPPPVVMPALMQAQDHTVSAAAQTALMHPGQIDGPIAPKPPRMERARQSASYGPDQRQQRPLAPSTGPPEAQTVGYSPAGYSPAGYSPAGYSPARSKARRSERSRTSGRHALAPSSAGAGVDARSFPQPAGPPQQYQPAPGYTSAPQPEQQQSSTPQTYHRLGPPDRPNVIPIDAFWRSHDIYWAQAGRSPVPIPNDPYSRQIQKDIAQRLGPPASDALGPATAAVMFGSCPPQNPIAAIQQGSQLAAKLCEDQVELEKACRAHREAACAGGVQALHPGPPPLMHYASHSHHPHAGHMAIPAGTSSAPPVVDACGRPLQEAPPMPMMPPPSAPVDIPMRGAHAMAGQAHSYPPPARHHRSQPPVPLEPALGAPYGASSMPAMPPPGMANQASHVIPRRHSRIIDGRPVPVDGLHSQPQPPVPSRPPPLPPLTAEEARAAMPPPPRPGAPASATVAQPHEARYFDPIATGPPEQHAQPDLVIDPRLSQPLEVPPPPPPQLQLQQQFQQPMPTLVQSPELVRLNPTQAATQPVALDDAQKLTSDAQAADGPPLPTPPDSGALHPMADDADFIWDAHPIDDSRLEWESFVDLEQRPT